MKKPFALRTVLLPALLLVASAAYAQDYSHIRIVRLSFAEGTVQYQGPGQDWQDADLNLPIQEGFALRTVEGYAEIEFEQSLSLSVATNSTVEFSELALLNGGRVTRLTLSQGTAYINATLRHGDTLVIATPQFTVSLPHDGRFRVDAGSTESWVSVFHGKVSVALGSGAGESSALTGGHTLHVTSGSTEVAGNPPQDDFDKWVERREEAVSVAQNQTDQILGGGYTEGFADLYDYGIWSDIPGYGGGWIPYGMGPGWMPFVNGQWMFMGFTGWNWVSAEPWGWLPYHFGSWVNASGIGWAWLPIGAGSWLPATATWVQVNNQLGWVPVGPPTVLNSKRLPASAPPIAILAGEGASGVIRPGSRIPLAQGDVNTLVSHGPAPSLVSPLEKSPHGVVGANEVAGIRSFAQSSTGPFDRNAGIRPVVRAPGGVLSQSHAARLSSVPHAMMAPHSLPLPAIARGAANTGFREGFGGQHAALSAASPGPSGGFSGGSGRLSGGGASTPGRSGGMAPAAHTGGSPSSAGTPGGASGGHH